MANGFQNLGAFDGFGLFFIIDGGEVACLVFDAQALLEGDGSEFAIRDIDRLRTKAIVDDDAFFFRFRKFVFGSRHLFARFQAIEVDSGSALAESRAGDVHCDVAAADNHDIAVKF